MLSRQFLSDEKRVHTSQEIGRVRLYNVATCTGVKCFLYDLGRRFLTDEQYFGVGEILRSRRAASIDSDPIANIEIHPSEGYVNTGIAKAVGVSKSGTLKLTGMLAANLSCCRISITLRATECGIG